MLDYILNNSYNYIGDRMNMKNKVIFLVVRILFFIFLGIFIFSGYKFILWIVDNKNTKNNISEINDVNIKTVNDEDTELVNEDEDKNSDYWYYTKFSLIDVDIKSLKEKNSDTVGWINVNNTNINYPFVQYSDNEYYLNHSYNKSKNEAGWVFLDYRNSNDFSDKNNILYAHSRLDKTMFGSLSKVFNSKWQTNKDNHVIKLSTENENTLWQIFSVYKIKEESYYITTNFYDDNDYSKFLEIISNRSIYNFNSNVNINDSILTLSTCYSNNERTVVHAKLIKRNFK